MQKLKEVGGWVQAFDGPSLDLFGGRSKFGMTADYLERRLELSPKWQVGQLYGLVDKELTKTRYVFRGLKRPMLVGKNGKADVDKLVFVWKPKYDYLYRGGKFDANATLLQCPAEAQTVFFVIVSPNIDVVNFPSIAGWIEHWAWIDEEPESDGKPVEHRERYEGCIKEIK